MRGWFGRLWSWLKGLKPWQRILLGLAVALALAKAWDLAGLLLAGALDVDRIAGRAKGAARSLGAARRRAKAVSRTADAAGELLDAVGDLQGQHAESDAEHDAAGRAADAAVVEARHAEPPADDAQPLRSRYLEGE